MKTSVRRWGVLGGAALVAALFCGWILFPRAAPFAGSGVTVGGGAAVRLPSGMQASGPGPADQVLPGRDNAAPAEPAAEAEPTAPADEPREDVTKATPPAVAAGEGGGIIGTFRRLKVARGKYVPGEVLVKFRRGVTRAAAAAVYRRHRVREIYTSPYGGFKRLRLPEEASVPAMVAILSREPAVEYVEPNTICRAFMSPNDPYYALQWHLDDTAAPNPYGGANGGGINVEPAWDATQGAGAVVAVLDTGVAYENYRVKRKRYYRAPDLADTAFVAGYDFIENDTHPNDDNSHGTHVTGTIAQSTNNALGVAGVAFRCRIMPVKVLDKDGYGTAQTLADGIRFAADHGAKVINLSLGWPVEDGVAYEPGETVRSAVEYAYNKGVTLVCAAGNDGQGAVAYPAAYDAYCIAVGATRYDETRAAYSNYGPSLDLMAPGGDLAVDQNGDGYGDGVLQNTFNPNSRNTKDFGYWFFDGTSVAAPHVSGVAALVIAQGVGGPDAVRGVLQSTAEDKGAPGWDPEYGYGIVDAGTAAAGVPANNPPVAQDDAASTNEDTAVTVNVLANDTDADAGDTLAVSNLTQPSHGTAVLNADQTVTYTPAADFNGADAFAYTATDGKASSNVATVTITVAPVNDPPTAQDDAASTVEETAVTINVLANDSDPDGDTLAVAALTQPANGSATLNADQSITYAPDSGFTGTDAFTYTAADGNGGEDTATVTVTVNPAVSAAHVSIALSKQTRGRSRWRANADVTIRDGDASGAVIPGATVRAHWSGAFSKVVSGVTGADGKVRLRTKWIKRTGTVTLTVDKVTKDGVEYPLTGDTSASITHTTVKKRWWWRRPR